MNSAWVGVVGSLGGVAVGGAATWLIESARWRRTERTRWYDDRRRTYASFMAAAGQVTNVSTGYGVLLAEGRDPHSVLVELAETSRHLYDLYGEIRLISETREVVDAAAAVIDAALSLRSFPARADEAPDDESAREPFSFAEFDQARSDLTEDVVRFRQAARKEIGLPDG